jgi:hypothetical protein
MGVGGSSGNAVPCVSGRLPLPWLPHTILAVLLPRALHLRRAEALVLVDLEMPQRLSRRLVVRILHAHCSFLRVAVSQCTTCWTVRRMVAQPVRDGGVRRDSSAREMSRL